MLADSNQTGTLEVSRQARSIPFGVIVRWLIIGLVIATLLMGLAWSNSVTPYPGAERQEASHFQIGFQPILSQESSYQTTDDLPQVLGWYTQQFGLGHEMPQGDNCITMTQVNPYSFLQQSLAVTLCGQQSSTLIFVNRNIAVR